jgi:HemY protein
MARRLIIPLIVLIVIIGGLLYVGSRRWINITILPEAPVDTPIQGLAMSLQSAIVGLCLAVVAVIALWSLAVWMWRLPKRMKTGYGRKRESNGLDAVEAALIAGEAGDGDRARKKALKAHELLGRPALTELVSAKAAEACGATSEAKTHYTTLLGDPKTEAVGRRGLARMADASGDFYAAIEMAQTAYAPAKGPAWAFDLLFNAQMNISDWSGAIESLTTAEKRKHVDKEMARRRRAVLLSAQAAQFEENGDKEAAIETALKAVDASAGFAPGAALAARLLHANDQSKKAASMIEKAWAKAPHPALALAYRDVFDGETGKVIAKKIKALVKANPEHRESAILSAEQALLENDGGAAITALGGLLHGEDPSARLCALASAAEEKLGNQADARAWHLRAASGPVEPDWSDLDPDGPAFKYTDQDWRRLVTTFGEAGELIHPRYESGQRRRAVVAATPLVEQDVETPEPIDVEADAETDAPPPQPDDPGVIIDEGDAKDLASRLNNLLGNKDKN